MQPPKNRLASFSSDIDFVEEQHSAQKNSQRVKILKRLMIIGCILITSCVVLLVIHFNYFTGINIGSLSISSEGLVMRSPIVTGGSETNNYKITADKAIQQLFDPNVLTLKKISADIINSKGESTKLTADDGIFHSKDDVLTLNENIKIIRKNEYSIYLKTAHINLADGSFESNEYVYIQSKNGELSAMQAKYDETSMRFLGDVKVTLQPTSNSENQ